MLTALLVQCANTTSGLGVDTPRMEKCANSVLTLLVSTQSLYLKQQRGGEGDGLYERARAMEAAKYAVERVLVQEGRRGEWHSPRLAGDGEKEG